MSSKPAAIPLFADAYLADTMHLTTEEHGAYFLLLMAAWRQDDCSLPNDDKKLARIVGLTGRKWQAIRDTMLEFWTVEGDRMLHTGRCDLPIKRRAIPLSLRRAVIERDGNQCRYCGDTSGPFEIDHVMPWSRGGKDVLENLVRACRDCNRAKSASTPSEMGWTA